MNAKDAPKPTPFERYVALTTELCRVRAAHHEEESPEEDEILDAMDPLWWEMSDAERAHLDETP